MYPNLLKTRLQAGETVFGTGLPVPSPIAAGIILETKPDFVWIDTEHTPFGSESLGAIPVQIRQKGVAPLIRVAWNDPALIKKAYDVGAVAVMVPQVNTCEEAELAVRFAKYPPEGERGVSPMWALTAGEDWNHVITTANEETVLVVQIESTQAYDNIDEIKQVPGIDVLLVGPLDLSASVGRISETGSAEVQAIMRDVPSRLEGTGIAAGTTLADFEEIKEKLSWGYRFMNVGNVLDYGATVVKAGLDQFRHLK
jgi:4-hydroxy-2-oxoheptanedioate aldolase